MPRLCGPARFCIWEQPVSTRPYAHALRSRSFASVVSPAAEDHRERVVILGSGWAGYILSRRLDTRKFKPIVVSPRSYFVFTPFLNDSATGTLEFRAAVEPVRKAGSGVDFIQAWADDVDFARKTLTVEASILDSSVTSALTVDDAVEKQELTPEERRKKPMFKIEYDKLVIAVGCYSQTFNTPGIKENALFLKDIGDGRKIRRRILELFEMAGLPTTPENVKRYLLHFAVVGGGPTGTEFAATLSDLIREDLRKFYPDLMQYVRITLFDVAPRILSMFDQSLTDYALKIYKREGVEIKTSHHIEGLRRGRPEDSAEDGAKQGPGGCYTLRLKEEGDIGVGMVVWSTGNMANPFIKKALTAMRPLPKASVHGSESLEGDDEWQVLQHEKTGSIRVDDHLQVQLSKAHDNEKDGQIISMGNVYAIGDNAVPPSGPLPATAQVANQEAVWLAKHLNKGDVPSQKFTYKDLGVLTYLGSSRGLVQGGGGGSSKLMGHIRGRIAYFIWRGAYLVMTLSWKNRLLVPYYWVLVKLFGRDVSRF